MDIPAAGFAVSQPPTAGQGRPMSRGEILAHYRRLRVISTEHHSGAFKYLASTTFLQRAKRLGLAAGHALITDNDEERALVFDLAIHTATEGRSRVIDRYAKALPAPAGSHEARMLEGMCAATFSIWKIECRHDTLGLVVTDMLRERQAWLLDEALESSGRDGMLFASRLCFIDGFAMTCGVVVPVTVDMIDDVLTDALGWRHADLPTLAQDARFAAAIYRAALDEGIMDRVVYV